MKREGVQAMTGRGPNSLNNQEIMGNRFHWHEMPPKKHIQRDFWVWGLGQGLLGTGTGNLMNT